MIGFVVVNPEVLIARALERGGRAAPGLDFIRWRLAELRAEVTDDAEFWGVPAADIARSRAEQLAVARLNTICQSQVIGIFDHENSRHAAGGKLSP